MERVVDEITTGRGAAGSLFQIRLPMTGNPLKYVNGYLFVTPAGSVLVDCGWDMPDVRETLDAALSQIGRSIDEIVLVVATHFHADHYGHAGAVIAKSRADLAMHALDWNLVQDVLGNLSEDDRRSDAWLERNGMRIEALSEEDEGTMERLRRFTIIAPTVRIEDGALIETGGLSLRVIWTPGHSPGHICLIDQQRRMLLSGDHILNPITPHVGIWRADSGNPLAQYVASLRKLRDVEVDLVLPAHGEPFAGLTKRVDELLAHHIDREDRVLAAFDGAAVSAAAIAARLPWTRHQRALEELSPMHQQFAVAETIAHLEELRAHGKVTVHDDGARVTYARAA